VQTREHARSVLSVSDTATMSDTGGVV
jgi:hypothetical protein